MSVIGAKVSFNGGEYSENMQSRVDLELYRKGCKTLLNFIPHVHGGISNRPGLYYIATAKEDNKKAIVVPFEFSTEQAYMLEFGDYYIRFYKDGLPIEVESADAWQTTTDYVIGNFVDNGGTIYYCIEAHTSGTFATDLATDKWVAQTEYEIPTPYGEDDLQYLNYTQSADILYLAHPDYAPRQLERNADTNWDLNLYVFSAGPFMPDNTEDALTIAASATATGSTITLSATGFNFDADHTNSLWKIRHYIEGQAVTTALGSVTAGNSIQCGGTWRIITHGTWTGTIRIEKSTDGGSTWTNLREFSSADDYNADTYGIEEMLGGDDPFLVRVNMTAYTSGTCNANLTCDAYYRIGIVKIISSYTASSAQAIVQEALGSTAPTADLAEGSWSDYRGWPGAVEFHPEDRLIWANTYGEPDTYWMTESSNYTSFRRNSPLTDSDGISSPLRSRQVNGINGMIPLSEMIMLTSSNEFSIKSSSGPLTPTTAYNRIHGWEGSYGIRPIVIGNRGIYVQATGSIIRDLGYSLDEDVFTGADLTVLSNHMFFNHTIVSMAYQQNPDRIIWCVRDDGVLLSLTYMREQDVIAWARHNTYGGTDTFESVAVIRGDGYDEVWVVVKRGTKRYIERFAKRMDSTEPENQFFVDSGITYNGVVTNVITGLSHLEGRTVSILADGNVLAQQEVTGSSVTLNDDYLIVHVGLPYNSDVETLNIEASLKDGTAQGRKIKVSRVILRLLNSRGGYIGPDSDTLYEVSAPVRAVYDDPLGLFTGDQPETLGGGYSNGGRIFFRQSQPLPVTILSLIPEIEFGGVSSL